MKRECNQDGGAEELWEENFRMLISGAEITAHSRLCRAASTPRQKRAAGGLTCEDWKRNTIFPFQITRGECSIVKDMEKLSKLLGP